MHHTAIYFMQIYGRYIHRAEEPMKVKLLVGSDIKQASINGKKTVAGLDHWTPEDFGLLSDGAYTQLAKMYNATEAGMPWPAQLTQARAAFLPKEGAVSDEILGYRVLTILPVPY